MLTAGFDTTTNAEHVAIAPALPSALAQALEAWTSVLGADAVKADKATQDAFKSSTVGVARQVPAVLYPRSEEQVQSVVRIAEQHNVQIHPVSTGRNWGYSDSSPTTDGSVVVNLSRMNRILATNPGTCYASVTVQPGVTQQVLHDYLYRNDLHYMVPVHGGGPDCSILGNALERGYGITPITDHFSALTSLRAVLPDGAIHESLYEAVGASTIGDRRKSQIGPDVDSLFAQGNQGIVTQAKIRLRRRPRCVAALLFRVHSHDDVAAMAPAIEEVLTEHHPKALGGLNLMNRLRVLSMLVPYPGGNSGTLSAEQLEQLGRKHGIPEWTGAATLYAESRADMQRIVGKIRKRLKPHARMVVSFDRNSLGKTQRVVNWLPGEMGQRLRRQLGSVGDLLDIASGKPSRVALPLAKWRSPSIKNPETITDPAAQGCGIIWYSPYVPIDSAAIDEYRCMVEATCREHGIEPLITLTSVDDQTFDSTVPILFDREDTQQREAAQACYAALLEKGLAMGIAPYRFGVQQTGSLIAMLLQNDRAYRELCKPKTKAGIIAPGRYASTTRLTQC